MDGLKFIVSTSLFKDKTMGEERELLLAHGKTTVLNYLPKHKERGLIITLTGFSVNGYKDQRMVVVNNAFKKMGFRVITPKIDTIDFLLIDPKSIDQVKDIIQSITADTVLNPNKCTPAVFAPSFTAGIAALAIAEMPENSVRSLCLLGSFSDFESTIAFASSNENNADDYGMHILMNSFLREEFKQKPQLQKLVQTALEDNGLKRKLPLLPALLAQTDADTLQLYNRLKQDKDFRNTMIMDGRSKIPNFEQWKSRLNLSEHAHKITCPVSIIHGTDDQVIPSQQSVLLYNIISKNNSNVHLELSNLLDHGDMKLGYKIFAEIAHLAKAFQHFIKHAAAKTEK
jgi:pimeloyl-ACP methyl ester carboxylesterase